MLLAASVGCSGARPAAPWHRVGAPTVAPPDHPGAASASVLLDPQAVRVENARPGADWLVHRADRTGAVAGYASSDSVRPGESVELHLHSTRGPLRVEGFRIGWYGGTEGRRVFDRGGVRVAPTGPPVMVAAATRTVAAGWPVTLRVPTGGWLPGDYLFRLTDPTGVQSWVPETVRSSSAVGAVVLLNATTTWQAYNAWGGWSLYHGPRGGYATRAFAVSTQRPYDFGAGGGDFVGDERPLVALAEQLDLPLAYETSTSLDADPQLLDGARAVISLGHDEYWSTRMRNAVEGARSHGTNVAFLGANAVYRHVRFVADPNRADRLEVDYKDGSDPIRALDPSEVTTQWRSAHPARPESVLTGAYYQCNGVKGDLTAVDDTSWLTRGLVAVGQRLPGMLGDEYDQVVRGVPEPGPLEVLFHSPLTCRGRRGAADAVYYSTPTGAGGFDAGTSSFVCALAAQCAQPAGNTPANARLVHALLTRLLRAFAAGPAGRAHPARDTAATYEERRRPSVLPSPDLNRG